MQIAAWSFSGAGRLRASIHWDARALDPLGGIQAPVVPDYDLFLWDATRNAYRYASQSNEDNNEGFDVSVEAGDYQLFVAWPDGVSNCFGGDDALLTSETVTWGAD